MTDNRRYGLLLSDINNLVLILKNNEKIDKVILFGSRAKGDFSKGSDIDISIRGNDLGLNDILSAKVEIEKLLFPYKVDIVIYNRIKENALIEHIGRVGISLFER